MTKAATTAGAAVASYGNIHAFTFQNPLRENPILDQLLLRPFGRS